MSYQDVMNVILPRQDNHSAHITGHYGEHRAHKPHGGSDFNYVGGQTGINLTHPTLHSPVEGTVTFVGGKYGTIKIEDAQGNSHEILHTQTQSVAVGQRLAVGDAIGTMGGRGPDGATQYAQHVHYQMKDSHGHAINPETFWSERTVQASQHASGAPAASHRTEGALHEDSHGPAVMKLQVELKALGYTGARNEPLHLDGDFGPNTKRALETFQRDHGMKVDGIAGPATLGKLREVFTHEAVAKAQAPEQHAQQHHAAPAPKESLLQFNMLISNPAHPGHAMFDQARAGVEKLDEERGAKLSSQQINSMAAALAASAKQEGLTRIDHVALSTDQKRANVFAVQDAFPMKQYSQVPTMEALSMPVAKSTQSWEQANEQITAQAQQTQHRQHHHQDEPGGMSR